MASFPKTGGILTPIIERAAPRLMPWIESRFLSRGLAPLMESGLVRGGQRAFRAVAGAPETGPLGLRHYARGILAPRLSNLGAPGKALAGVRNVSLGYTGFNTAKQVYDSAGEAADQFHTLADSGRMNGLPQEQINRLQGMNRWNVLKSFAQGSPLGQKVLGSSDSVGPSDKDVYDVGLTILRDRVHQSARSGLRPHEILSPGTALVSRGLRFGLGKKNLDPEWRQDMELARMSGIGKPMERYARSVADMTLPSSISGQVQQVGDKFISDPQFRGQLKRFGTTVGLYGNNNPGV